MTKDTANTIASDLGRQGRRDIDPAEKLDQSVAVRLSTDDIAALDKLAHPFGRSTYLRHLIRQRASLAEESGS